MHTVKFQTIINTTTNEILNIFADADIDKSYQDLQKIHANTFLPIKVSKFK